MANKIKKTNFITLLFFLLNSFNLSSQDKGLDEIINESFKPISSFWERLILHEFLGTGIPTIILLLVGGAAFFTFFFAKCYLHYTYLSFYII